MKHLKHLSFAALLVAPAIACSGSNKADTVQPEPAPAAAPIAQEEPPAKPPAKKIPDGFFTLTPQLTVRGVDQAIDFYAKALGAEKVMVMPGPDGKPMHAEIRIGDSLIMLDEENLQQGMKSPLALGGTSSSLLAYVDDADAAFARVVEAGAKPEMPPEDMFWGDRYGTLVDPFGHRWAVATHLEDLTPEQMQQRAELLFPAKGKKPAKAKKGEPAWKKIAGTPATAKKPAEYHTIVPAYVVADAAALIDFYKAAFGATEVSRMLMPNGKVMHAELQIGDSRLMLSDEDPQMGNKSAKTLGGSSMGMHMYTEDVDGIFAQAKGAKAIELMPVETVFWGDRYGAVIDPAGVMWGIATHVEDVTPEEMAERMKAEKPAS